jgi:hypothetical protein
MDEKMNPEELKEEPKVGTEEKVETKPADEIEIFEDPDAWKKGLAVVVGITALSFVGGFLTGIFVKD